ncbi:amino acid adenylation domain-containing protein [Luteibacter sp. CQ10]|uniref:amino acid adenylation domain-containing protein n=1 Tax=Luteibacter sp. CQ10 TaxID=2805821 RepID=UPI0034A21AEF
MTSEPDDISALSPEQLQALANRLLSQRRGAGAAEPVRASGTQAPLTYAQEALWLVERLGTEATAYNETVALRIDGPLDADAFQRALAWMVERHDALRMRIVTAADGSASQVAEAALPVPVERVDLEGADDEACRHAVRQRAELPFDLHVAPLFRASLLHRAATSHIFVWVVHHIVWDGWSSQIFVAGLMDAYAAFRAGRPPSAPREASMSYAEFAAWQRGRFTAEALQAQRAFWRDYLDGAPALLRLPHARERPARRDFRGATHRFQLPSSTLGRLDALGRAASATLYMTLLAVFQVFLARLCDMPDIVVRTPSSGRTHPRIGGVIGLFVNLLALRTRVEEGSSFNAHLVRVRERALEAFGHQNFPYEWLVAERAGRRDLSHEPIAQVDFVLRDAQHDGDGVAGLKISPVQGAPSGAINDLTLVAQPTARGLDCEFVYATGLFDADDVQDFAERFLRVAHVVAEAPDASLGDIDMRLSNGVARSRYPLTAIQRLRWADFRRRGGQGLDPLLIVATLPADVDVATLQRAVNAVTDTTVALRLSFAGNARDGVWQTILSSAHVEVRVEDRAAPEVASTGLDMPAMRCLLVPKPGHPSELQVRFHPLAVDEAQASAIVRRCLEGCRASDGAAAVSDEEPFVAELRAWREAAYAPRAAAATRARLADLMDAVPVDPFPASEAFAEDRNEGGRSSLERRLSPRFAACIDACAASLGHSPHDVLFAWAVLFLHRLGGMPLLRLGAVLRAGDADGAPVRTPREAIVPVAFRQDDTADMANAVMRIVANRSRTLADPAAVASMQALLDDEGGAGFRVVVDVHDDAPIAAVALATRGASLIRIVWRGPAEGPTLRFDVPGTSGASWEREALLEAFAHFLDGAARQRPTDSPVALTLLGHAARATLLERCAGDITDTACVVPVHRRFARHARTTPEAVALRAEGETLSYRELDERANRFAHHLVATGIGPGALVGLFFERCVALVVAMLGVLKAGAAYLPLDTDSPDARLEYFLGQSRPGLVATDSRLHARLAALRGDTPSCVVDAAAFADFPATAPAVEVDGASSAYAMYTSGSTGMPKCVDIPHAALLNRLRWMEDAYAIGPDDRILQKTPYTFDVSVWEFLLPLMCGGCLVLARPGGHRDVDQLHRMLGDEGITVAHFVPSMLAAFLARVDVVEAPALRHLICSGEALPADLARRFLVAHPTARLHNLYGPTEAAIDVTAFECARGDVPDRVPIGRAIWNTRMLVLDDRLDPVPPGVSGELYIGGIGLARGYRYRPDLTADRFVPDPHATEPGQRMYRTGDLARCRGDGTIDYLGRRDQQVKLRGVRIEPGEIEASLAAHPSIRDAVVVVKEYAGDRRLVAYVTSVDDQAIATETLRDHLKAHLPPHMVPAAVVRLSSWPLSANGKLDRNALPLPEGRDTGEPNGGHPTGDAEEALARIWEDVLAVRAVGRRDNFFELGGHSLLGIQVLAKVHTGFGVDLPFEALFECRDLHELAKRIETIRWSRDAAASAGSEVAKERERFVL